MSRFAHLPCLKVEDLLFHSDMGIDGCLAWINRENRLIEVIIRRVLEKYSGSGTLGGSA